MFSCELCEAFGNTCFNRTSPVAGFVFSETKVKMEKYIHTNIFTRKAPVMVSFLVRLQPWGLTTLLKSDSLLDVFVKFAKFYRISFLQKTAGRLVLISCNISDISLTLLAINQLSHNCLSRTSTKSGSLAIHSVYLENI